MSDSADEQAEREQLKVFQDRGMVIIVLDGEDLANVERGANLIHIFNRE